MMACDPNCGGNALSQGGMGYPAGGALGCCQPMMGYNGPPGPTMGYPGPPGPTMGYPGPPGPTMGYPGPPGPTMGYPGPLSTGYQPSPFETGSGCCGTSIACGQQDDDIPRQARVRKPKPPNSIIPKRKIRTSYTTLVTPLAGSKKLVEEETKDIPPDHERFDTLTLAFGTKPGTDKPPKILLTLKSPKVIDAKLGTGTAATQVHYRDLGLPDANAKNEDAKSKAESRESRNSKFSAGAASHKSKSIKGKSNLKGRKSKK